MKSQIENNRNIYATGRFPILRSDSMLELKITQNVTIDSKFNSNERGNLEEYGYTSDILLTDLCCCFVVTESRKHWKSRHCRSYVIYVFAGN